MCRIRNELGLAHFYEMQALERTFYPEAFITPAPESYAYYVRFPRSTTAAFDGERIVGFVNLFPVRGRVFQAILRGIYNDSSLTYADMADPDENPKEPLHMFLSCIAVEPAYRRQGLTGALLAAATAQYAPFSQRCDFIVTDNVTPAGERFSNRLGFAFVTKTDHDSTVYKQRYPDFERRVQAGPPWPG